MRVRVTKRSAISAITLPVDFAKIVHIDDEVTKYKFFYELDIRAALQAGGVCLEMSIVTDNRSNKVNIFAPGSQLALTPDKFIDNLLMKAPKNFSKVADKPNVLLSTDADFTAFVSNDTMLRGPKVKKAHKYVSAKTLKESSKKKSVIPTTIPKKAQGTFVGSYKVKANKLVEKGTDPASMLVENPTTQKDMMASTKSLSYSATIDDLYSGVPQQTSQRRVGVKIAASDNAKILVTENVSIDRAVGFKYVPVPTSAIGPRSQFYLRVRLLGPRRTILGERMQMVKHTEALGVYYTPRIAPIISASTVAAPGLNTLSVKQCDPIATSINVYRKSTHSSRVHEGYALVGNYAATSSNAIAVVRDAVNNSRAVVYRAVAVSPNGTFGTNFGSVVAKPAKRPFGDHRFSDKKANVTLDVMHVSGGILVRAYNYHDDVAAVQFLRKNISKKHRNWSTFNNDLLTRLAVGGNASTIDADIHANNIYEYTARLTFRNGVVQIANNITTIRHERIYKSQVTLDVAEPEIDAEALNIKFNVKRNIESTTLDTARQLIQRQGLAPYFGTELQNERTLLNHLVVTRVERIDLETGDIEDLGMLVDDELDNNVRSANTAARALRCGGRYRYVLYTYQRKPETVFDQHIATTTHRGRQYQYSPAKYKSPQSLRESTIVTQASRKQRGRNSLLLGDLVSIDNVDVSIMPKVFSLEIATMRRLDEEVNDVQWTVTGDKSQVDHVLVFARRFETTEPVAAIHLHGPVNKNVFQFQDKNGADVDSYEVVVVYNDYTTSAPVIAQEEGIK